ncbi:hypothetical protein Mapa_006134 [Marchantia paleacea]|nr:hypothetical protein Mapa_006134 [Marchantia paleacea]
MFIGLIISIARVLYYGRLLERVWGSKEFVKFIAFTNFFTMICTFGIFILLYYVMGHENLLYTPTTGFHIVLVGFLISMKQSFPYYEINVRQFIKLRAKCLPSFLVLIVLMASFFVDNPIVYVRFIVFGTHRSWIYLQFFQRRSRGRFQGDCKIEFVVCAPAGFTVL